MSEPQAVTSGKDPKRVQWGKKLGQNNKGRKKVSEDVPNNNKMIMVIIGIGVLSIGMVLYFKKSEPAGDTKQEPDPPKKQIQDLSI